MRDGVVINPRGGIRWEEAHPDAPQPLECVHEGLTEMHCTLTKRGGDRQDRRIAAADCLDRVLHILSAIRHRLPARVCPACGAIFWTKPEFCAKCGVRVPHDAPFLK